MKIYQVAADKNNSNLASFDNQAEGGKKVAEQMNFGSGTAVAIGNYDGVHLGHQHILSLLKARAEKDGLQSILVTFEPYPAEYFSQKMSADDTPKKGFRIMGRAEKIHKLAALGIDSMVIIQFDDALSAMSAEDFVSQILARQLNTKVLLVGNDFRFGYRRQGDIKLLANMADTSGYELVTIDDYEVDGAKVSSSRIRQLMSEGNISATNQCLGSPFNYIGRVIHGQKRGRSIGFPTANIEIDNNRLPLSGVFVVRCYLLENTAALVNGENNEAGDNISDNASVYKAETSAPVYGVCNLGHRPTYHSDKRLLEVHLFEWNDNLYAKVLNVELLHKIRDEMKFDGLEALTSQIEQDVKTAKDYLLTQKTG